MPRSANHSSSSSHCSRESTFLYVGPDVDVAPLSLLDRCETNVVYIEPLTWFGNRDKLHKIGQRIRKEPTHESPLTEILRKNEDRLFECSFYVPENEILAEYKQCEPNVTLSTVQDYASDLRSRLETGHPLCKKRGSTVASTRQRFRIARMAVAQRHVSFDFYDRLQNDRKRTLTVLVQRVEDIDFSRALLGSDDGVFRPISTACILGVGPSASALFQKLCTFKQRKPTFMTRTLRTIHRDEDGIGEGSCRSDMPCSWNCGGWLKLRNLTRVHGSKSNIVRSCPDDAWLSGRHIGREVVVSTQVAQHERRF